MTADAFKTEGFHALQCELNLLGDPTLYLQPVDPVAAAFESTIALLPATDLPIHHQSIRHPLSVDGG